MMYHCTVQLYQGGAGGSDGGEGAVVLGCQAVQTNTLPCLGRRLWHCYMFAAVCHLLEWGCPHCMSGSSDFSIEPYCFDAVFSIL